MPLEFSVQDHVALMVLNRPQAMNAMEPEMRSALIESLHRIDADEDIHVGILTAVGDRAFCTGNDLKSVPPPTESFATLRFARSQRPGNLMAAFETDKPLICAINGYAIGGGLEYALACDIRIASENARFGLGEVKIGSIPGFAGTQRLPRAVGVSNAMMMLLTGDHIDAQEALRMGLISKIVPLASLREEAMQVATKICANAPLSVRAIKRLVKTGMDLPLAAAIEHENFAWGLLRDTEDRQEGRKAFREKRRPAYKGR